MVELADYHIGDFMRDIGDALGANEKWRNEVSVKRTKSEWGNKIGDLLQIRQQKSDSDGYQQVTNQTDIIIEEDIRLFQCETVLIDDRALDPVPDSVVHFDQKS